MAKNDVLQYGVSPPPWIKTFQFWSQDISY